MAESWQLFGKSETDGGEVEAVGWKSRSTRELDKVSKCLNGLDFTCNQLEVTEYFYNVYYQQLVYRRIQFRFIGIGSCTSVTQL